MNDLNKTKALEKLAFGTMMYPTVGVSNPPPTVSDVLHSIEMARVNGVGTPGERRDAFGRIVGSGLENTSPAGNALRMIGGGILGRAITGAFTKNDFVRGLGTGIGAISAVNRY